MIQNHYFFIVPKMFLLLSRKKLTNTKLPQMKFYSKKILQGFILIDIITGVRYSKIYVGISECCGKGIWFFS